MNRTAAVLSLAVAAGIACLTPASANAATASSPACAPVPASTLAAEKTLAAQPGASPFYGTWSAIVHDTVTVKGHQVTIHLQLKRSPGDALTCVPETAKISMRTVGARWHYVNQNPIETLKHAPTVARWDGTGWSATLTLPTATWSFMVPAIKATSAQDLMVVAVVGSSCKPTRCEP